MQSPWPTPAAAAEAAKGISHQRGPNHHIYIGETDDTTTDA